MATYDYNQFYKQGNDIYRSNGQHLTYEEALPMFQSGFNASFIQEKATTQPSTPAVPAIPPKSEIDQYGIRYTPEPIETNVPETPTDITLPKPQAPTVTDNYLTSATQDLENKRKALEDSYNKQIEDLQRKQDESQKRIDEFTAKQETTLEQAKPLTEPFRTDMETTERERLKVEENYFANQTLTNELDSLLTEGNALIKQQKEVTGLGVIRNPRITQTISDVNARAGVIQAVMSARSGQIAEAYRMIDRSIEATTADRKDQLGYYNTLLSFYSGEKDTEGNKLVKLDAEEKQFLDAQIGLLENDLANSQKTVDNIKSAMSNPQTALIYSKAGITLNDSIETINKKLSDYSMQEDKTQTANSMAKEGYQVILPAMLAGKNSENIVRITNADGTETIFYKPLTEMERAEIAAKNRSNISSGGVGIAPGLGVSGMSDEARGVLEGTIKLEDLTPTTRGKIVGELTSAGYQRAAKLSTTQQNELATMETVKDSLNKVEAYNADGQLEGVGGFWKGTLEGISTQFFGTGSEEAKNVRALISNVKGTVALLRGGTSFTTNEQKLLEAYTPTIDESPASIMSKIEMLKFTIDNKRKELLGITQDVKGTVEDTKEEENLRIKYNY